MNNNGKKVKRQAVIKNSTANILSPEELARRIAAVQEGMKTSTWRELETNGKFTKNDKLTFISDDMLILGCDIGSEMHYVRAIDSRGRELSRDAFPFSNSEEGFQSAKDWALELAASNDKRQIVLGLELTGHYWFCLAAWMVSNGISVVQVNPYAVKQTKELEDNSQRKDDRKDPKLIANLVKDGNYAMPAGRLVCRPEAAVHAKGPADRRPDQEHQPAAQGDENLLFGIYGRILEAGRVFTLEILKAAPFPEDILKLGTDGLKGIWHEAKLRGRGYSRAEQIVRYAGESVGLRHETAVGKKVVKIFAEQMIDLVTKLDEIEAELHRKCRELPQAENILELNGIGGNILSGILSEMGDITRFDDAREIQKLSGLGLVACSSGKHKGETKISHRGRKRLRYWLLQAAKSVVSHAEEFKILHEYYTTRPDNPLKKMQSLIVIACKILRVIYTILKTGEKYDPARMLKDIKHTAPAEAQAA